MADGLSHQRRVALSTVPGKVSGALADFPVLFTAASLPAEIFGMAETGGGDIRFSSDAEGTALLPSDIVRFTAEGEAEIWVRLPQLRPEASDTVYLWYGAAGASLPAADAGHGRNAVWQEAELALLMEGTAPVDRSGRHALSLSGALAATGGPYGGACRFDAHDRISSGDAALAGLPSGLDFSVSCLLRASSAGGAYSARAALSWVGADAVDDLVFYDFLNDSSPTVTSGARVFWRQLSDSTKAAVYASHLCTSNAWHWLGYSTEAVNRHRLYSNGALVDTGTLAVNSPGPWGTFYVGGFEAASQDWGGDIARLVVWQSARTADWMAAEYANQSDPGSFMAVGAPEAVAGTVVLSPQSVRSAEGADAVSFRQRHVLVVERAQEALLGAEAVLGVAARLRPGDGVAALRSGDAAFGLPGRFSALGAILPLWSEATALRQWQRFFPATAAMGLGSGAVLLRPVSSGAPQGRVLGIGERGGRLAVGASARTLSITTNR
jgi:hypothetical protein